MTLWYSQKHMDNYYQTLGLNSSATEQEIRRAYRILARRYHPDVNPGKDSSDKFKEISEAYKTLSDQKRRERYDLEYEAAEKKFQQARYQAYTDRAREHYRQQSRAFGNQQRAEQAAKKTTSTQQSAGKNPTTEQPPPQQRRGPQEIKEHFFTTMRQMAKNLIYKPLPSPITKLKEAHAKSKKEKAKGSPASVSIIEVSITVPDAIKGVRKTIEIAEQNTTRKISVTIPAGSRTGSVVRMRNKQSPNEELVLVIQVAHHPFMSIEKKGLVVDLPVTVEEAVCGANVTVPTLDDQIVLKVPAGTQSGTYIRVAGKGIQKGGGGGNGSDGARGDLFYRVFVKVPEISTDGASPTSEYSSNGLGNELKEKVAQIGKLYGGNVRGELPKCLA